VWRFFQRHKIAFKKSLCAAEPERADVARARRRWMREQGLFDPARLVFIDETSANTKMVRLHGRCASGERLVDHVPQGHSKTITLRISDLAELSDRKNQDCFQNGFRVALFILQRHDGFGSFRAISGAP
jgi:hypothetical protein